jgi:predicted DNA-binding transcriptional regulator AlpA
MTASSTEPRQEPTGPERKEWMTTAEFADAIGCTPAVIYWLNYAGTGPPRYRFGRELRWRRSEVEAWIESRRIGGTP